MLAGLGIVEELRAQKITFVQPLNSADLEELRTLYDTVGISPDIVDVMVSTLQLRWDGARFLVTKSLEGRTKSR